MSAIKASSVTKKTKSKTANKEKPAKKSAISPAKSDSKAKYFYFFGPKKAAGSAAMRDLLGGKGANLAEMCNAGLPVPPGFTMSTDVCRLYYDSEMSLPDSIDAKMKQYIGKIEQSTGSSFGSPKNPLLLSVRSGSKFSMPGMMDTVLNLGLNEETVEGLAARTGNMRFALDNYRRLIAMFGNVVMSIDKSKFEDVITKTKKERRIKQDSSLQVNDLKTIVKRYKQIIRRNSGEAFPDDPFQQLRMARDAIFRSWNNPRAISYRRMNDIPSDLGTAVNVQAMVFGNMGNNSGTGVGFTRNPSTGENEFFGEYLINAQGEDVVAGVRTPQPISKLANDMPKVFKQLKTITTRLEKHYRDLQDFEFTVQEGELFMLQTRSGKRTVQAAIRIAVEMVKEKMISKKEAVMRIEPNQIDQLLHSQIDPKAKYKVVARGLAASPGAASGKVYFTAESVMAAPASEANILVREETNPDDIEGMSAASGILTARGGTTSHAAVVARGMGKCCVSGAESIRVNVKKKQLHIGKLIIKEGEVITINGSTGDIILGKVATVEPEMSEEFSEFMSWADEFRKLKVRTNADTPRDAARAVKFGAEGIGLCRTEHMFFAVDRIPLVQDMILADTTEERQIALGKLMPMQKKDFKQIFDVMGGRPVTIRTLDPPLHEFLPRQDDVQAKLDELDPKSDDFEEQQELMKKILRRIDELTEVNPMLGNRGCRLGIMYPEITEMQVRAILEAACEVIKAKRAALPEIMIPLVGHVNEFKHQKEIVHRIAREVIAKYKMKEGRLTYQVGTMIEIPRAALTADEIGAEADFFSFGTNDLTQLTFGYSRDDAAKYLTHYIEGKILEHDPFVSIDQAGVGSLVVMAKEKGLKANSKLKVGVCGEHGGDPDSVRFFHSIGLDYVSCSPYRVPVARLAAARAAIE